MLLVIVPSAAADPWDYGCKSALGDIESAVSDAQRARRDAEDSYEAYKRAADDFNTCRRFPDIYDLWKDGCRSKYSDAESAKRRAESDLDTFTSRFRSVVDATEDSASRCGYSRPQPGQAASRTCRVIAMMRRTTDEAKTLEFCGKLGVTEPECRRCMQ